jgi:hypothetical protein
LIANLLDALKKTLAHVRKVSFRRCSDLEFGERGSAVAVGRPSESSKTTAVYSHTQTRLYSHTARFLVDSDPLRHSGFASGTSSRFASQVATTVASTPTHARGTWRAKAGFA